MSKLELALAQIPEENAINIRKSVQVFLEEADEYKAIIESIEIQGIDDKESIKKAREARLFLKNRRGDAKSFVSEKRAEVKAQKLHYDLLDNAYLKTFQLIEATYREIEEIAQEKEDYVKILEQQIKEEKAKSRWAELSKYMDEEPVMLAEMTDQVFELTLQGAKSQYEARIEAERKAEEERLEQERIEREEIELSQKRQAELRPYYGFIEVDYNLRKMPEEEYQSVLSDLKQKKADHEAEQEKIRLENERLKKEAEEKEALVKKRSEELRPFIQFIRDYSSLIGLPEKEYSKQFSEIKKGAEDHWEFERKEQLRIAKEQEEIEEKERKEAKERAIEEAKRQAELDKVRKELELEKQRKAEQEAKEQRELEEKLKAEEAAKKAPEKDKILKALDNLSLPVLELSELSEKYQDIVTKFSSFKNWAKNQIK